MFKNAIKAFYANGMLRSLVIALVGIFTPVFLYKLGLAQFGELKYGVMMVAGYFLVVRITSLIFAIPISHLIEKIGFRRSIFFSIIFLSINLASLIGAEGNLGLLVPAAISAGLNIPLYWVARNSAISQDADKKQIGQQMGWLTTLEQIASMLAPLASGLIVERWGFVPLYMLALLILIISVVPLFFMAPHVHKNGASLKGFYFFVTNRRYFHNGVGIGAKAVDDYSLSVFWPLSIFLLGISTSMIGGLFSVVALAVLLTRMGMGRVFDKLHLKRDYSDEIVFGVSAVFSSVLWAVRLFVTGLSGIFMVDLTGAVIGTAYSNIYVDYEHLGGMRMGSIAYWVYADMVYSLMTMWIMALAIIGAYFSIWREVVFLSASFWVLISVIMARESNING